MATVRVRSLCVDKPPRPGSRLATRILHDVSIDVQDGELLVLIGPSGCGKSTLLRCIAGLETVGQGDIAIDGRVVNDLPPRDRDIAMVFQSYALYPHMTVSDNLAFALRLRGVADADVQARVQEAAEMLEIGSLLGRFPRELSGGQRQRVAMGRAVVRRPQVFLFDEPLSNLDAALRQQMRVELLRLHRRLGTTTIYVTHDQTEAMTLAHRIAVLRQGRLVQLGTPRDLYDRPCSPFVARFFGTPEMNLIAGRVQGGRFVADGGALAIAVPGYADGDVTLGVRAEDLLLRVEAAAPAVVDVIEDLGSDALAHVALGTHRLVARAVPSAMPAVGAAVAVDLAPGRFHLFARGGGDPDGTRLHPKPDAAVVATARSADRVEGQSC